MANDDTSMETAKALSPEAPTIVPATVTEDDITEEFPHIREFQNILIHMPSGNVKMINLKRNTMVALGKFGTFLSDNLIDKPFGLSYEIYDSKGSIRPVRNWALEAVAETEANNQTITDDASVQKLSQEEVEMLKQEGLKGNLDYQEIIQKMIESHAEFDKKTEFSKAKYVERKKQKFMKIFTPVRPTLYSMTEYFFNKNPEKIRHLRVDTLSQLLSLANVRANSKLLVVDDTQGLIVSAVAERMGGYGTVVAIHDGENHNFDILRYMNYSKHILSTINPLPLSMTDPSSPAEPWADKTEQELSEMNEFGQRNYWRRKRAWETKIATQNMLFAGDFDGLIISSQYDPKTVVESLQTYLCGSRPIVIFSIFKETLLNAAHWMRKSSDFIAVDITESTLRQYQVLPGRTHPEMNMSGGGGYLLSAIRIISCPFDMSLVVKDNFGRRKKRKTDKNKAAENKKAESKQAEDRKAEDRKAEDNPTENKPAENGKQEAEASKESQEPSGSTSEPPAKPDSST